MKLNYEQIRIDGGTQPRAELLIEVMEDYAEQMRNGVDFPPITVFFDGKEYWLADGFHRFGAALRARPGDAIEAEVIQGTQADAQWYSFGANKTHGLRRNNPDKVRAVRAALSHPNGAGISDRQIAEHVGVSHEMVRQHRAKMGSDCQRLTVTTRTGRDNRTINTAKIGKNAQRKAKQDGHGVRISRNAHTPKLGHSDPCPMIPLLFSPNNPRTAAATLWQHFSPSFIKSLISELTQRLSAKGDPE